MAYDPTKPIQQFDVDAIENSKPPEPTVDVTPTKQKPPTGDVFMRSLSPERAALREAAHAELNRRILVRAKWALELLEQGKTLPAWMSANARDNYVLSSDAITIRGGHYDQQLKRWVDVPDLGVDPFRHTSEALEREIFELQMEGEIPGFSVRGSTVPNIDVVRRIVERRRGESL
jgi:hypothetical protein